MHVAKTKALICVFVFAYAKCWFSHDAAQCANLQPSHCAKICMCEVLARPENMTYIQDYCTNNYQTKQNLSFPDH